MAKKRKSALICCWHAHVAGQDCLCCGQVPVEVAHFKGLMSQKTGLALACRSGINDWAVLPLCRECHRLGGGSFHMMSEASFFETRLEMSRFEVLRYWASMFTAFIVENAALGPRKR